MKRYAFLPILLAVLVGWGTASALTPMEQLGKDLFFDANLSTPAGVACASCHAPTTAFVGPVSDINAHGAVYPGAVHTRFGNRKPPSAAYASFSPDFHYSQDEGLYEGGMFWDGRALNTVEQAKGPFLNPVEMNNPDPRRVVTKVLKSDYKDLFRDLYMGWIMANTDDGNRVAMPSMDIGDDTFIANAYQFIAESIAGYEASSEVNQFSSKYDAYLAGNAVLTLQEQWGLDLFEGKALCANCHLPYPHEGNPPLFTDYTYDNLGIPRNPENPWYTMPPGFNPEGEDWTDYGLGAIIGDPDELGKVKVPTLRNVAMRPYEGFVQAYGHNGYFKSLEDIVHFYNTRDVEMWPEAEVPETVNHDELGNLMLSADEEAAIVAFLGTLTDGWTGDGMMASTTAPRLLLGGTPNPFHGATEIAFSLPGAAAVNLDVFDVAGRQVRRLLSQQQGPGRHTVIWDATNDLGQRVVPGVYFYRLTADQKANVQRIVLLP